MTARSERAVRANLPGKASDRRDTFGRVSGPLLHSHSPFDKGGSSDASTAAGRSGLMPSAFERELADSSGATITVPPKRIDPSLGVSGRGMVAHFGRNSQDLISFRDMSLILDRLESHRGAFRLLSHIRFCGPCTIYEMRRQVSLGQRAFNGSLRVLLELRLVEPEERRPFPFTRSRRFRLTERGRALMRTPMEEWSSLARLWSCI